MTRRLGTRLLPRRIRGLALALALAACGDGGAGPDDGTSVDLEALFAPATAAEMAAVRAEWAARDPAPVDVKVEMTQPFTLGGQPATLRVLSHAIPGGRHYGAVIAANAAGAKSLPALVYLHGGDGGASSSDLSVITTALGGLSAGFVWIVPSFRAEPLVVGGTRFTSGGEASPWDKDVDDAIALLGAALAATPAADPERVGAIGFSRGAGVALMMGIRDRRVDRVVEFFGPTDFFDGFVRDLVERALDGGAVNLPGFEVLDARYVQPLGAGTRTIAEVRHQLALRSPALFARDLPPVQVHHGTADPVVAPSQAESLIRALQALGRGAPGDGYHLYPAGVHDLFTLPGSVGRALEFLRLL